MRVKKKLGLHHLLYKFTVYFFVGTLASLTLLAFAALTPRKWNNSSKNNCNTKICVSDTGIHSNIIVPTKTQTFDWHNYLSIDRIGIDNAKDYNYLSFGWGDRNFYMSTPSLTDLQFSTTFAALFLPTPSVIYVKKHQFIPVHSQLKCIKINPTDYLQLTQFIQSTFKLNTKGQKVRVGDGHTNNAGFYAAVGKYSILRNCNSWTGEALRKANVNTPLWDGISAAILFHLKSNCN